MRAWKTGLYALLLLPLAACLRTRDSGPGFTVTADPAQVRLLPGLSQKVVLTLKGDPGFQGSVQLAAPDPGPGVQAKLVPASVELGEATLVQVTLTLTAAESAPTGRRTVAVRADSARAGAVLDLAVDVPVAAFFTVITYRGTDPANFAWLAYQDGNGPWSAVPGSNGLYRLPITDPAGRFGVLLGDVCASGTSSTWISNGFHSSLGETQSLQTLVFCNPQPGPPPVTFDLQGALAGTAGGTVLISANSGLWSFPGGALDYELKLQKGTGDLVAAVYPSTQDYIPARLIVERGRDAQAPATRDFDFNLQAHLPPPRLTIQRPAVDPDETFQGTVQYQTSRGQVAILGYGQDLAAYAPFPAAASQSGDAHLYSFQASGPNHSRSLQASTSVPPGPLAPTLPSRMAAVEVTRTGASSRLGLAWNAVTPAPAVHEATLVQQVGGKQVYAYLYFSQSWHGGATRLAWAMPDLAEVPGFDPGFLPQAGVPVAISVYQSGSRPGQLPSTPPSALGAPLIAWRTPPAATPFEAPVQGARMQLRPLGPAAALAPAPWQEYWSVRRSQTFVP